MRIQLVAAAGAALALVASSAAGQSLADRIGSGSDGAVQFTFAARPGVCGNGRGFVSVGSTRIGSYSVRDDVVSESCAAGPVRVVVSRAGGVVTSIETTVGTPAPGTVPPTAARDIGQVPSRQAAEYLLGLAARSEGRPGRDAIMPAALADSADVWQSLVAIARDAGRPRESRTTALTWLGRVTNELAGAPAPQVSSALVSIASDQESPRPVREQAVSTLARLPRGDGIPALVQLAGSSSDSWLARRAMTSVAGSGDPRARAFLRTIAARDNADQDIRFSAIRGLGNAYTTGEDMAFLRQLFVRLTEATAKDAVIASAADAGGRDNVAFLMTVAGSPIESPTIRRRALQAAGRADAPIGDLTALYARVDRPLKEELINIYSKRSESAAIDRLIQIAKSDEDTSLRRKAISVLSRSDDPRVIAALREIIVP